MTHSTSTAFRSGSFLCFTNQHEKEPSKASDATSWVLACNKRTWINITSAERVGGTVD